MSDNLQQSSSSSSDMVHDVASKILDKNRPATSEQMNEMIALLKKISDERSISPDTTAADQNDHNAKNKTQFIVGNDDTKKNDDDAMQAKSIMNTPSSSKRVFIQFPRRFPQLPPPICHPFRKLFSRQKRMVIMLLTMSTLVFLSAWSHFVYGGDSLDSMSLSSLTSTPETIADKLPMGKDSDKTLYFHTKLLKQNNENGTEVLDNIASPLPNRFYPYGTGSAICILVTNRNKDVEDIMVALWSLRFLTVEKTNGLPLSPVLIFHEGDLSKKQMKKIRDATDRPIAFPKVDLASFPSGFEPDAPIANAPPGFEVKNRKPWGYYQMIRFWLTTIWDHPAVQRFDTIMRMDSDSCFTEPNTYLPHMLHDHLVYHSQYVGTEPPAGRPYIEGLYDFATSYLEGAHKFPGNAMLWQFIQTIWNKQNSLPLFRTNFEVSKLSFMQRPDVKKWHTALTEEEPFGVLRYRWGDAVIRFFDAAIFATDETTLTVKPDGYNHKKGCSWPEVEQALQKHNLLDY